MIAKVKELRVQIDGLIQLTKELKPIELKGYWAYDVATVSKEPVQELNSDEINKAADSLLLAKAWLGKLLEGLGSKNPYSSGKKEVKDIEPTADTYISAIELFKNYGDNLSHIEKVDWLREEINKASLALLDMKELNELPSLLAVETSLIHLHEARMWLGFEFTRIQEESK